MHEISKDNLLRSWKDIAAYLGVDVRTCHRWEAKHGMPVHRAESAEKKSPVFAYKDELDAWFKGTFRTSDTAATPLKKSRPGLKWALAGAAFLVLSATLMIFLGSGALGRRQPADFSFDGSVLVVKDKAGRELWRRDTFMEDFIGERYYREHFQVRRHEAGSILPAIMFRDIDGDGDTEVLFAPKRVTDQTGEGVLFCYGRRGDERWRFRAGRELRCGGKTFSPDYRVMGFHTRDFDGDGKREIVVEAFHAPDWPCQLAVLDHRGNKIGEYWNAGYLRDIAYWDINGDGREELVVVGVNNEYRSGCLIVFDTRAIGGASPQSGPYVCQGLGPGTELYYLIFPRTDVSDALGLFESDMRLLDVTDNGWIKATTSLGLIYDLDSSLKALQVTLGHGYVMRHEALRKEGKLTSVLDADYERMLLAGIRWWNGTAWTDSPAANASGASGL